MFSHDREREELPPLRPDESVEQLDLYKSKNDCKKADEDENASNNESINGINDDTVSHIMFFRDRLKEDLPPLPPKEPVQHMGLDPVDNNDHKSDDEHDDRPDNEIDTEIKFGFPDRPRDMPIVPPSPSGKERQLADAINEHKQLLAAAECSAKTYHRYHEHLHSSQKQIFRLRAAGNPTGLTANARAEMERGVGDMKSYWFICMDGERERWSGTLGQLKAIKVKVCGGDVCDMAVSQSTDFVTD